MSTPIHDIMVLETTQGPVKIEMRPDLAPQHVARIKELVQSGFYDGIVFHRVIEGFMAQTGCPHGTGTGGSGVKLKAEFNTAPHVRGTASMARAQNPDSGDSQFFICFDDARFLDRQYTVWGQVISGMDNLSQTMLPATRRLSRKRKSQPLKRLRPKQKRPAKNPQQAKRNPERRSRLYHDNTGGF